MPEIFFQFQSGPTAKIQDPFSLCNNLGADSVTLTAGLHTVDARLTYADGRQAVVSLEITVQ